MAGRGRPATRAASHPERLLGRGEAQVHRRVHGRVHRSGGGTGGRERGGTRWKGQSDTPPDFRQPRLIGHNGEMPNAVIVDVVRTPVGKKNGRLSGWHAVDLAAQPLRALIERNDLDPALVEDVVYGCTMTVGEQAMNIGRNAALAAGFPDTVPGHHGGPAVRFGPAGRALRGPGGDVGGHGHGHRRRGRGHEPGAHRLDHRARARRGLRPDRPRAVRLHPSGTVRRGDRQPVGDQPRGDGPLRPAVPRAGGPGHRRGAVRERDRAPGHPTGPGGEQGGPGRHRRRRSRPTRGRSPSTKGCGPGRATRSWPRCPRPSWRTAW